jgi:ubiquinone/menaquinone biosynthesis C-methylase UbiE
VDISKTLVDLARRNAAAAAVGVRFEFGNAAALPIPEASQDFVVCRAAFKNFAEPVEALREMRRVLRPDGNMLLIDMRRDVSVDEISRYVDGLGVSWLNRLIMMVTFRGMLIKRAYRVDDICRMMAEAGWANPRIELHPLGFEAMVSK